MAISASFHRNVVLLTQLVPPDDNFKRHFREGMFDKPNTAGFLYVSHYLLTLYDPMRFKKLIEWPVTCKKTEAKYRNSIKDYLISVSLENPDIGFPNILTSHLFHAGGSKFTIIMWKLSQVVVRTYINRESTYNVMYAPQIGVKGNLAKSFLEEANKKLGHSILNHHNDLSTMEETVETSLRIKKEALLEVITEIFEKEQILLNLVSNAPVHSSIQKRLTDIQDDEVIQMWETCINDGLKYVKKQIDTLQDMERLTKKIVDIIMLNSNDANVLDAKRLERIDSSALSGLHSPEIQCCLFHLYKNDELVLSNFIQLFTLFFVQLHARLKSVTLKDLTQCLLQIEASCKDTSSALNYFQLLLSDVTKKSLEVQSILCQKKVLEPDNDNTLSIMNKILTPSPLIKINTNCNDYNNDFEKRLHFTPVEAAHKSLFSRYEHQNRDTLGSKVRQNSLISRINFDDTLETNSIEKESIHTRLITPKKNLLFNKQVGKYSRLFSSINKKNRTADLSIMSLPCSSNANSTAIANTIGEMHNISQLDADITTKSSFNISEFTTPEKIPLNERNKCEIASEIDDIVNALPAKLNIREIPELTEVEVTHNYNNGNLKIENTRPKRRSIGDLVDRYRKLLEHNNRRVEIVN